MLVMKDVCKIYRTDTVETHALRGLSLTVEEGEFLQKISEYERIYADATKWPRIYRANKDQIEEYKRNNIKPLVYRYLPNYKLICTKPVRTMADLKDLKIRTFGSYMPKMFAAIDVTPVNVLPRKRNHAASAAAAPTDRAIEATMPHSGDFARANSCRATCPPSSG